MDLTKVIKDVDGISESDEVKAEIPISGYSSVCQSCIESAKADGFHKCHNCDIYNALSVIVP